MNSLGHRRRAASVFQSLVAIAVLSISGDAAAPAERHPDLQGVWDGSTLTPLQRPQDFREKATFTPREGAEYERTFFDRTRKALPDGDQQSDLNDTYVIPPKLDRLRTSLIVDPANGMLPPVAAGNTSHAAAWRKRSYDNPETLSLIDRCLLGNNANSSLISPPIVPAPVAASFYQIVQTPDYLLITTEWIHDTRIVRLHSSHPPSNITSWMGDSIAHWDGNTLVVDTTNLRPDINNQGAGERLHVVERFTRLDAKTLNYRVTVEDPDTWTASWTAEWHFRLSDSKIMEVACHEGDYNVENFLRGARADERALEDPKNTGGTSPR
jgi:hypothetical protein